MLLHGDNKRIALVFFLIGHGHRKAAETLTLELKKRAPATRLVLMDALVHVGPLYRGMVNASLNTLKHFPLAQGVFYRARVAPDKRRQDKRRGFRDLPLETAATPFSQSAARLEAVFTGSKWDMIVCTDPVAALIFSMLKGEGKVDIPVIMVATDFGVDATGLPNIAIFFSWPMPPRKATWSSREFQREGSMYSEFRSNPRNPSISRKGVKSRCRHPVGSPFFTPDLYAGDGLGLGADRPANHHTVSGKRSCRGVR